MERRKRELASSCEIEFEGKRLDAIPGEPLMVTLLAHGIETASRSVKYHRPRGAFCMTGICGQCWMRIDDLPNRAACTTRVHPGLKATRENAFPSADFDVFRAADKLFADGLDHHRLATTPIRPLNLIMQDTARRLAGLGSLSTTLPEPAGPFESKKVDVVVIGAGPAGLAAGRAVAASGLAVLIIEARSRAGGQLATHLYDDDPELSALLAAPRGELWLSSTALGVYREEGRANAQLLVRRRQDPEHLALVEAELMILANGGYEQTPLFESNDLPGHYGARALATLIFEHGVMPASRVVIADGGVETGSRLHARLKALGVEVVRVVEDRLEDPGEGVLVGKSIVAARGGTHVKGVEVADVGAAGSRDADRTRIACEVIASAMPVAPAFELGRQAGCTIEHRTEEGGFAVAADPRTRATSVEWIYAAGDVSGAKSASFAMLEGEIAGLSAVLALRNDQSVRARRDALAAEDR